MSALDGWQCSVCGRATEPCQCPTESARADDLLRKVLEFVEAGGFFTEDDAGSIRLYLHEKDKIASRLADRWALEDGTKTPEQLKEENAHFARLNVTRVGGKLS